MMMKKWMAALLAAVMMVVMLGASAQAQETGVAGTGRITVQGTAKVQAEPDLVKVTANASVTGETVGAAQEKMNAIIKSATQELLAMGLLADDVVTSDYSYYPRYNYETDTVTGYEANHTLSITCRDVKLLDGVIDVVTHAGFSQIYNVSYDVSVRSDLYQQALDLAIMRAQEKAVRMAQTGGMTITALLSLTENGGYNEGYAVNATADAALLKSAAGASGIRSGMIEISAGVTAVYEAK